MISGDDFMDVSLLGNPPPISTRREFLAAVASCSSALLLGAPSLTHARRQESTLQGQVVALVKSMRSRGLIRPEEKTSWSMYDFTTREKLVAINEDIPRQAASMIKPFVAQAYFFELVDSRGKMRYTKLDFGHFGSLPGS